MDKSSKDMDEDCSDFDEADLLSPTLTTFLSAPVIATPEKARTPINNDFSPITPLQKQRKKRGHKFSLMKLVNEKSRQEEMSKKLSKMDEELKAGIEKGGILNMISQKPTDEDLNEISGLEELPKELLPQHQKELQKVNEGFLNDFPDGFLGEHLFIHKPIGTIAKAPSMLRDLLDLSSSGELVSTNVGLHPQIREILICGFLVDIATLEDVDDTVLDWLLACVCHSADYEVIEGAFKAFWTIITLKEKAKRECHWHFSLAKLLTKLDEMGADKSSILSMPPLAKDPLACFDENVSKDIREKKESLENDYFIVRIETLLKCYSCCLKVFPSKYSKQEIACTVIIAFRLCIASEIVMAAWEIQVVLACAIDCYEESEWKEEAKGLCKYALDVNNNHSNRLRMVEIIPITERGSELKVMLALEFICAESKFAPAQSAESLVESVFKILKNIHVSQETDFHHLFSTISLVNYCLPDDSVAPSEKKKLDKLISTLRSLNCEIRDPGGRFMNRTKVKDLIVRVISQLTYISRGLKTQSSLDGFFGEAKSSFDELQFETPKDKQTVKDIAEEDNEEKLSNPASRPSSSASNITDDDSEDSMAGIEDPLFDLLKKKDTELTAKV